MSPDFETLEFDDKEFDDPILSTYCLVAACKFAVGSAFNVNGPVIVSPDLSTLLFVANVTFNA